MLGSSQDEAKSLDSDGLTALRKDLEETKRQTDIQPNELGHILCELICTVKDVVIKIK